jgi:hypothetical protein
VNKPTCLVVRETWVYLCASPMKGLPTPPPHISIPEPGRWLCDDNKPISAKCESRVRYYLHAGESSKHSGVISTVHVTPPPKQSLLFFFVRDIQLSTSGYYTYHPFKYLKSQRTHYIYLVRLSQKVPIISQD